MYEAAQRKVGERNTGFGPSKTMWTPFSWIGRKNFERELQRSDARSDRLRREHRHVYCLIRISHPLVRITRQTQRRQEQYVSCAQPARRVSRRGARFLAALLALESHAHERTTAVPDDGDLCPGGHGVLAKQAVVSHRVEISPIANTVGPLMGCGQPSRWYSWMFPAWRVRTLQPAAMGLGSDASGYQSPMWRATVLTDKASCRQAIAWPGARTERRRRVSDRDDRQARH